MARRQETMSVTTLIAPLAFKRRSPRGGTPA